MTTLTMNYIVLRKAAPMKQVFILNDEMLELSKTEYPLDAMEYLVLGTFFELPTASVVLF